MIVSLIITVILLYVAYNTEYEGSKLPIWIYVCILAIGLASWQSAIVLLCLGGYSLYKGIQNNEIDTLDWIEDLVK